MKKIIVALSLFALVGSTAVVANAFSGNENTEVFRKKKKKKKKDACSTETKTSCGEKSATTTETKKSCCASKKAQ
jgi:hypothetical protein